MNFVSEDYSSVFKRILIRKEIKTILAKSFILTAWLADGRLFINVQSP